MRRYLPSALCLLLAIFCLLGGFALYSQQQTQSRGLDLGAPLNRPTNLYGINVDLLAEPDPSTHLSELKDDGFGWVRQEFDWEKTDWASADRVTASTRANELKLVAVLTGERPPDPAAFAAFAREFAARFKDSIDYYQIWDEPNLESGWAGPPNAAEYARLLQAAYTAIHEADPTATVVLAGLAPTVETGPKNISDLLYLRQLYEIGAQPYFDAVAGKPYGFNDSPDDRTADPNILDFSRLILLREEMIAHGDGGKLVWSSNFGWNTRPSIWGQVTEEQQREYTIEAYGRAALEWQWAGPLFLRTPDRNLPPDDPAWGFDLNDYHSLLNRTSSLLPGQYTAANLSAYAILDGAWEFSELGADIPQEGPATISINFVGTELAITVRRADYRAYLFVTIDGQPANALPRDTNGEAYLILTSPDLKPHTDTLTLAAGLAPGQHTAVIHAERGWDQWAIVAFTIGPDVARPNYRLPIAFLSVASLATLAAALALAVRHVPARISQPPASFQRLGDLGLTLLSLAVSALLYVSAWLTWGSDLAGPFRRYGDAAPLVLTIFTAGLFYYSPFFILTLLSLLALFVLFYLRPDLALPLIAFFAPLYLLPRPLWDRAFSMVEICTVLGVAATASRFLPTALKAASQSIRSSHRRDALTLTGGQARTGEREEVNDNRSRPWRVGSETYLDLAVLAFVIVCALTIPFAEVRGVALREFRVVVVEPALFYLMLRIHLIPRQRLLANKPGSSGEGEPNAEARLMWRIVDSFLIGAVVVALYGLSNLLTGQNLITAEGGVARIRSVFGSPNNLGLFLGRAIPIAAAVALLGGRRSRRILYGLALLPLLAAAALSFSRGALLLGIPAALVAVLLFWGGRRAALALAGLGGIGLVALIPLSRNPRFANLLNISSGTGFFRVNVWRSAWAMFADHPLLGVGLDNFLYAYRGWYILPEAWEEPNLPHAHNIVLDALTRTGLLGLLALAALLISFFKLAVECIRQTAHDRDLYALSVGLLASMVNFIAHGMVDTGYWFVDLAFVFMMTLGLIVGVRRAARRDLRPS